MKTTRLRTKAFFTVALSLLLCAIHRRSCGRSRSPPPISSSATPKSGRWTKPSHGPGSRRAGRPHRGGWARTPKSKRGAGLTPALIDAAGKLLLPGFNDSHVHFVDGGLISRQRATERRHQRRRICPPHRRTGRRRRPRASGSRAATGMKPSGHPATMPTKELIDPLTPGHARIRRPLRRPHGAWPTRSRCGWPASPLKRRILPAASSCATRRAIPPAR